MDSILRWKTLTRFSWLMVVLAALFHFSSGISEVTKAVQGMAALSCNYNISVDELSRVRIYWQKENNMVLSIISGNVQVWSQYQNRTFPDITNNLSLVILALRLSDRGTYTCVVQKTVKGSFKVQHLTSVMLSIKADFPTPSITDFEHPSPDLRRILCSTSGGFPKPSLSWLENGEELKAVNTTVYQDPETELYTVHSNLDFNVTSNHSFMCLIKYGDLSVSQIFNWEKLKEDPPGNQIGVPILIGVSVVIVIGIIALCFYCIYRPATRRNERSVVV
ncbi:T-lymphocyte activation antigen CD80 isoform X1 [Sciurus carolinensis]|uniref:T-lymphocyte activation antigen CD80 isoform X1 n=1 Tax=Sciurus carolinensis TaxID=30640 RepID=UPI001FB52846|nr:T-lymphocyte activation antigen CD80 isoform X1 [Sciurus carolinensis]